MPAYPTYLGRLKKGWKWPKKVFWLAFGCTQHPKAGQNTQQSDSKSCYTKLDSGVDQDSSRTW